MRDLLIPLALDAVLPDRAIYLTLGNFLKPLATFKLPKYLTFLGKLCKGVKIINFSSRNHFWATFIDIWQFFSGHTAWKPSLPAEWSAPVRLLF